MKKTPSGMNKELRQESKKINVTAGAERGPTGERIAQSKEVSPGHDPEYYHADNKQNRIKAGKRSPAVSTNKSAEEGE